MSENSKIEWCDHTFNPFIGCTKVSPGCANCYTETLMDTRYGKVKWGKGNPRQRTSAANWRLPLKWNKTPFICDHTGTFVAHRPRVFCASLSDWLDDEVPIEWLADLLALIHATQNLDWLLLTKRPKNWQHRMTLAFEHNSSLPDYKEPRKDEWLGQWIWGAGQFWPANVWIGTSVEDQPRADDRIPDSLMIPAKVHFLSIEPLLGPIDLSEHMPHYPDGRCKHTKVDWVIVGGESGPGARPMQTEWVTDIRDQCTKVRVPFLFKQYGGVNKHKTGRLLEGREWNQYPV